MEGISRITLNDVHGQAFAREILCFEIEIKAQMISFDEPPKQTNGGKKKSPSRLRGGKRSDRLS